VSAPRGLLPLLGLLALLVATPALAEKKPLGPGERVDLNGATTAELMRLPGVGKKKADEVTRVKGCSPGWYARVKAMVTVGEAPAAQRPPEPARAARGG
jgi:hypothetical protein